MCCTRACGLPVRRTSSRRSRSAAPPRRAASRRPASSRPTMTRTAICSTACSTASTSVRNPASTGSTPNSGNIRSSGIRRSPIGCASPGSPAARPRDFRNPVQTTTTLDAPNVNGYSIDFRNSRSQPTIIYPFDVTSPAGLADHRHAGRRHALQHHRVRNPHPPAGRRQQLHHLPRRCRLGRRSRPAHPEGGRLLSRI